MKSHQLASTNRLRYSKGILVMLQRISIIALGVIYLFAGSGITQAAQGISQQPGYNNPNYGSSQVKPFYEPCSGEEGSNCCQEASSTTTDGASAGCGSKDDPEENKKIIWNWFKAKGLSDSATAGIMGNMARESSFLPQADNGIVGYGGGTGTGCRGLVQWCFERNTMLDTFAAERNKPWDCVELQLEYIWWEMTETTQGERDSQGNDLGIKLADALNGADFPLKGEYSGSGPSQAASIFHDFYERANKASGEHLGRGEAADEVYREITGKEPPAGLEVSGSSVATGTASSRGATCESANTGGGVPALECKALIDKFKELVAAGRIKENDPTRQAKDFENCTEDPIECGTGGGVGGVTPHILRAYIAAVENTGTETAEIWSFNTGHGCDGLNHPKGRAVDIPCNGNTSEGSETATKKCNDMYRYFYDNYEELQLSELIWTFPPKGFSCGDPKNLCYIDGHADHIHVGVNPDIGKK